MLKKYVGPAELVVILLFSFSVFWCKVDVGTGGGVKY